MIRNSSELVKATRALDALERAVTMFTAKGDTANARIAAESFATLTQDVRAYQKSDTRLVRLVVDGRRQERRRDRLQAAADAGFDTWEDYRGER